jgi:hypothetical protein
MRAFRTEIKNDGVDVVLDPEGIQDQRSTGSAGAGC